MGALGSQICLTLLMNGSWYIFLVFWWFAGHGFLEPHGWWLAYQGAGFVSLPHRMHHHLLGLRPHVEGNEGGLWSGSVQLHEWPMEPGWLLHQYMVDKLFLAPWHIDINDSRFFSNCNEFQFQTYKQGLSNWA